MIEGVSNSSLIAAAFGPGAARRVHAAQGPAFAREAGGIRPIDEVVYPQPQDSVELSHETNSIRRPPGVLQPESEPRNSRPGVSISGADQSFARAIPGDPQNQLNEEDQEKVRKLKERDAEVRRHEQAHIAAGGQYIQGGAEYQYETGPDGKRYATSGEVGIDTSEVPNDPAATIRKMQVVRRAALAPANPSDADRRIASEAQQKEMKARAELQAQRTADSLNGATHPSDAPRDDLAASPRARSIGQDDASPAISSARSPASTIAGREGEPAGWQVVTAQSAREAASSVRGGRAPTPVGMAVAVRSYAAASIATASRYLSTLS